MIEIIPIASSSKGNMYILKQDNYNYLIECGLEKKVILKSLYINNLLMSGLGGCFITHIHLDHSLSCKYINEYMPIYACNEVMEKFNLKGTKLAHNTPFELNGMKVLPFSVEHGKTENLAFMFKDNESIVLFATDCMKFTSDLSSIKFTNIFIECNYNDNLIDKKLELNSENNENDDIKYIRQINTHMSLENLKVHLRNMDLSSCKKITLLHASKFLTNKEFTKKEIENEFKIKTVFAKE